MRPEDRLRARCRMWLDAFLPAPARWSAIEHGRRHTGSPEQRAREWERLKAQGVKKGLPDLMIWLRGRFIAIELKSGKNDTSEEQDAWGADLRTLGHEYHVGRSVQDVCAILVRVGVNVTPYGAQQALAYDRELAVEKVGKRAGPRRIVKNKAAPGALEALARARGKEYVG